MKKLYILICGLLYFCANVFSQADFSVSGSPCVGNEITFSAQSNLTIDSLVWEFGNEDVIKNSETLIYIYDRAGVHSVKLTVWRGSKDFENTQDISISENPVCSFEVDTVQFSSFSRVFTNTTISNNTLETFIWHFGEGASVTMDTNIAEYKYSAEGDYTVWHTIIDEYGCIDSISQIVNVSNIYNVPNVFTPNGDGINDTFTPTVNGVDEFAIEIFSRWGNLVFKRDRSSHIVWDGTMPDGSKVTPGTYFYIIIAKDAQKVYDPKTGFITVLYENGN